VEHHEGLTLIQQLAVFYNANVVVGPHGAALALLLACREGVCVRTRVYVYMDIFTYV